MVVALGASGGVLLERRPESGVWGGLWCLPEFATATAAAAFVRNCLGAAAVEAQPLGEIEHAFTHFDLTHHAAAGALRGDGRDHGGGRRPLV